MRIIKDRYLALTIGLVIFHVIGNLIWINLNQTPPGFDAAFQSTLSMRFYDHIKSNPLFFSFYFDISKYYPPVVHLVGTLFAFIAGLNFKSIQSTGTFFFAISLIFTYLLTDHLFKIKRMAFFSVFFFSFFMSIYEASRQHLLDIPMSAAILAGIYFLSKSQHLTKRKETLLFFAVLGIGVMIKWIIVVFFIIPLFFEWLTIVRKKIYPKEQFENIITGILLFAVIVIPWYFKNLDTIIAYGSYFSEGTSYSPADLWTLENFIFYLKLIITFLLTPVGAIFFLISIYVLLKESLKKVGVTSEVTLREADGKFEVPSLAAEKGSRVTESTFFQNVFKLNSKWLIVFSQIIFIYLFFSFVHNKAIRYVFPLMPFFAMVMGFGLDHILKKFQETIPALIFSSFIILFYIFSYFVLSFGIPFYPQYKYAFKFPVFGWMDVFYLDKYPVSIIYNSEDWKNKLIAQDIFNNIADGNYIHRLLVINDLAHLGPSTVNIALFEEFGGVPWAVQDLDTNFPAILQGQTLFPDQDSLNNYVNQASFVVVTKDSIGPQQAMFDYDIRQQLQQYFINGQATNFQVIGEYSLPDGNVASLYKRR